MSLYYHVTNKEEVLDGVVDLLVAEINQLVADIQGGPDWRDGVRARIQTARRVLLQHKWASGVIESRATISPAVMLYYDGLLGQLRAGGFSYDLAHHALHALGSRALGFTQELFDPKDTGAGDEESAALLEEMAEQLPHLVGMTMATSHDDPDSTLGWCDDQVEFDFGLDLLLDGLEQARRKS
jgi:AcrR family transcriptional regulator